MRKTLIFIIRNCTTQSNIEGSDNVAERYLFFNAIETSPGVYDREYQAQDFADYFGSVLSTGLLHTDEAPGTSASVDAGTLNTIVSPGKAIMRGHLYENTSPLILTHSIPEPTLDRIDRIVLRLNLQNSTRDIRLRVKEGTPAVMPVAPELQRDQFIHEISLAQIRVRKNTVQLLPSDLIDERLDENLCGLVSSLISIPTDQLQAFIDAKRIELDDEMNLALDAYLASLAAAEQQLQADLTDWSQQWSDWFGQQQSAGFVLASEKGQPGGVAKQDDFVAHKADLASQDIGKGADLIGLPDPNSLFTATTVGGAMGELFTNVSNGKQAVGTAITDVDPSVTVPIEPTFAELSSAIGQIKTGYLSEILPGDSPIYSVGAVPTYASTTYIESKSLKVRGNGGIRVRFALVGHVGYSVDSFGRVYINGIARGIERATRSVNTVWYTEDFLVNDGDVVSIFTKASHDGFNGKLEGFQLCINTTELYTVVK